ncbi:MAG: DsrE family protein [Acidiferrobacterales bacterium]|nr:DsrE family protein [Acidiferrobacterales bacterium]
MRSNLVKTAALIAAIAAYAVLGTAVAGEKASGQMAGAKHRVVIQVSDGNPKVHKLALNNAQNLQQALGAKNVEVEIVAYGPGLSIMTDKNPDSMRVTQLSMMGITFSACGNTMKKVTKATGKEPKLIDGVRVVPAGVLRVIELQQQGWSYVRP